MLRIFTNHHVEYGIERSMNNGYVIVTMDWTTWRGACYLIDGESAKSPNKEDGPSLTVVVEGDGKLDINYLM